MARENFFIMGIATRSCFSCFSCFMMSICLPCLGKQLDRRKLLQIKNENKNIADKQAGGSLICISCPQLLPEPFHLPFASALTSSSSSSLSSALARTN